MDTNTQFPDYFPHLASCDFSTSTITGAGTLDTIYISLVGDFSSSDPFPIGSFTQSSSRVVDIPLQRPIGNLKYAYLQTNGTDGWLLSKMHCILNETVTQTNLNPLSNPFQDIQLQRKYEFVSPINQWIDTFDPTIFKLYGNGYSPNAQVEIPSSSTLEVQVTTSYLIVPNTGY